MPSFWCGVEVWRVECRLRCRPYRLIVAQNDMGYSRNCEKS
ncbi:hypothetical protein AVEN_209083-1, partial [Araneus ventricosus]